MDDDLRRAYSDALRAPNRKILRNAGRNMSGGGTIKSPTAIANAYQGQLMSPQEALAPNAPDLYVPGETKRWLRGI